jgi:hypothetical protein
MQNSNSPAPDRDKAIIVPRDLNPDDDRQDTPPAAGSVNMQDEDYAVRNRFMIPGSLPEDGDDLNDPRADVQIQTDIGADRQGDEARENAPRRGTM